MSGLPSKLRTDRESRTDRDLAAVSRVKKVLGAAVSAFAVAMFVAVPASAEPGDNPCELAVTFLCQFVPMAPHLEGNVDLTQQLPPADPNGPPPESLPLLDPCAAGCI
jgi:hypothetical protein